MLRQWLRKNMAAGLEFLNSNPGSMLTHYVSLGNHFVLHFPFFKIEINITPAV